MYYSYNICMYYSYNTCMYYAKVHACSIAIVHVSTIAKRHARAIAAVHACTLAIIHACITIIIHSCTIPIIHACTIPPCTTSCRAARPPNMEKLWRDRGTPGSPRARGMVGGSADSQWILGDAIILGDGKGMCRFFLLFPWDQGRCADTNFIDAQ